MKSVKYGIIGCGGAWAFHSAGSKSNPKIEFKSVYDVNETAAKRTARIYKMQYFKDINLFLKSDIDAVLIMVPHFLHEEMVIATAEAGKHVLCEKPMATTLEGCDSMINATKKAGVKFMIAENHRFLPAHKYIKECIESGLIGDVFLVRSFEGVNEIPGLMREGFWKGHPIKAGGGALMDMGAHKFATMNWILNDEVESANAWLTKQCTNLTEKAEDNAMVHLQYKNGTIAETIVSFSVVSPPTNSLEVYGTKGSIIENHEWNNPIKIYSKDNKMGAHIGKWYEPNIEHEPFPIYYEISARIEDNHFTECILNDTEPEFTPQQAKKAIEAILLSYLSARKAYRATIDELYEIYKNQGTRSILEGLETYVRKNYCI